MEGSGIHTLLEGLCEISPDKWTPYVHELEVMCDQREPVHGNMDSLMTSLEMATSLAETAIPQ